MKSPNTWSRVNRWRRRLGFDGNDLRRDVDRTQWLFGVLLLLAFVAVASLVCGPAVRHARDSGARAERYEAATRQRVDATVVNVEPLQSGREVTIIWIDRDGTLRSGHYTSWRGAEFGDHPQVWVGPHHRVQESPPRTHARTIGDMVTAGATTAAAAGLPLLGLYMLLRHHFDRRRYRAWDDAWAGFDQRRHRPA